MKARKPAPDNPFKRFSFGTNDPNKNVPLYRPQDGLFNRQSSYYQRPSVSYTPRIKIR